MPFDGFTQQAYAQNMIDECKQALVPARNVRPQAFDKNDVLYWLAAEPAFGRQAVDLDDANTMADVPDAEGLRCSRRQGIRIWAPPTFVLITADANGNLLSS